MLAYSHTYEICINLIKNANEVSTILIGIGYRDKFNDFLFGFFFCCCSIYATLRTVVFSSQFHFRRELKLF